MQYRETDLAFVSRLMEQHGIYYFFEHTSDKHTMLLAERQIVAQGGSRHATTPFIPLAGDDRRDREHIYHWSSERRFRTGKVEFNDYDFKQPSKNLLADTKASERYTKADMKFYDDPGKIPSARTASGTPRSASRPSRRSIIAAMRPATR